MIKNYLKALWFRYKKKVPSSRMFWPLFRYIGGVNEGLLYMLRWCLYWHCLSYVILAVSMKVVHTCSYDPREKFSDSMKAFRDNVYPFDNLVCISEKTFLWQETSRLRWRKVWQRSTFWRRRINMERLSSRRCASTWRTGSRWGWWSKSWENWSWNNKFRRP